MRTPKDLENLINETEKFMAEGDYQIDGIVFVYNDIELQNGMGETAHHPRYKMVFKFQGETKSTEIKKDYLVGVAQWCSYSCCSY